ncbi:cytochrome P450 [Panaeolus papilionaceus]|nr:cytochrome P450 [Panaeolus papilionaceus]
MLVFSQILRHPLHALAGTLLICTIIKRIATRHRRNPHGLPLPPGPKGYPIIGNLFDMPIDKPWLTYRDWCDTYGDMVYYEVLGQRFLVLGSLERTTDLFEKRSSNYSDRMRMPMVMEMGWDYNMGLLPYGSWWRRHRRDFHNHFHAGMTPKYRPIQLQETRAFLKRLLVTPDNFLLHIRHTFGSTIMRIAYGITIKDTTDPYVTQLEKALYGLAEAGVPGAFLVDFIPALKYVPSWFPGASFKKKAADWRQINQDVEVKPFEYVKEQVKAGTALPSVASYSIERLPDIGHPSRAEEETIARHIAAQAYAAGADTTVSTVQTFFLAMALYPEVMKKAQMELDAVVGPGRLPEFSDRLSLPYVNAMVKESMRWQLVLPLAVGHMATEDDVYNGYFIPKGTVVIGNGWAILHDPRVFSDPDEYIPERYLKNGQLDPTVRDPNTAAFGYGRRICPGRHMSDNALFMIIASTLAVYDVLPPLDDAGKPIKQKAEFTSGLLTYPVPFQCRIIPRSTAAKTLIQDCLDDE